MQPLVRSQSDLGTGVLTTIATNFLTWRSIVSQTFVPLQVESDAPDRFRGRIRSKLIEDIGIYEVTARAHSVERTPGLIARAERDYYKVGLQLSGNGLLIQDNREALLRPGDVAVYDTNRPYSLVFDDDDCRCVVFMFPRHLMGLPLGAMSQLTAIRMGSDHGLGSVISPFLAQMSRNMNQLSGTGGVRLGSNTLDLITTMFASELDMKQIGVNPPRNALLREIYTYIDTHLSDSDLTPGRIAAAHFISTRTLHGIFRDESTTVSMLIRSRRLEKCRRDLRDPMNAAHPVSAIAARWGFIDAANFSRVFRATYSESPSDYRVRILGS